MKHCHFSILYNELPFLKQKLPFLYKHFDQIIFYDLNIKTLEFSNDGSHEFIKNYPDPQKKITLIEEKNLNSAKKFHGYSFKEKQKMFAIGSKYVKKDIDIFWCTDMDEFFDEAFFKEVEKKYKPGRYGTIVVPHVIYFKNQDTVFCERSGNERIPFKLCRISRHRHGHVYGHCSLQDQFPPKIKMNLPIHHFAYIGDERVKFKTNLYVHNAPKIADYYDTKWVNFNQKDVDSGKTVNGMHPVKDWGVKKRTIPLIDYINYDEMMKDLGV